MIMSFLCAVGGIISILLAVFCLFGCIFPIMIPSHNETQAKDSFRFFLACIFGVLLFSVIAFLLL